MKPNDKKQWLLSHVEATQDPLLRYVSSILKNSEAAEDIVQEAFLRLWKEDPKRLGQKVRVWLFHVSRNLAFDRLGKSKGMSSDSIEGLIDDGQISADEQLANEEDRAWLNEAIAKLSAQQREIVQLKFQADLSYKEIAAIIHLSISDVGVAIHQSLRILTGAKDKQNCSSDPTQRNV